MVLLYLGQARGCRTVHAYKSDTLGGKDNHKQKKNSIYTTRCTYI